MAMELLDKDTLAQVNQRVYQVFPELEGVHPAHKRAPAGPNVILTYRQQSAAEGGLVIERVVRVTVTPEGQVVKISTSH